MSGNRKNTIAARRRHALLPLLMATTMLAATGAGAQSPAPGNATPPAAAAARSFDIPAQSLVTALVGFTDVTGIQFFFDAATARNVRSPGASGLLTRDEALRRLLDGTGLTYRFTNPSTVTLIEAPRREDTLLPPVDLDARARRDTAWGPVEGPVATHSAAGTKTDTPIIETPQSISVITRAQMDAQGSGRVQEAMRYSAGVRTEPAFDTRYETMIIRGFDQARSGLYLNGLRLSPANGGNAAWEIEPYSIERIDILRGPSSVLYGQNAPGGIVNQISKRPSDTPVREIQLQGGNFGRAQGAVDVGGAVDADGKLLYRFTALARDSGTQTDHVDNDRLFAAPSLTWRPSDSTSLTLFASLQEDRTGSGINFLPASGTLFPNPNGRIPVNRFTSEPGFDRYDRNQYLLGYAFEHAIDDRWTVRQNARYGRLTLDYGSVYAFGYQDAAQRTLRRFYGLIDETLSNWGVDNQIQARLSHGIVEHTLLFGLDYQRSVFDRRDGAGLAPGLDIVNPVYGTPFATAFSAQSRQALNQTGVYAQDQIKIDRRIVLTLGGRHDWSDAQTDQRALPVGATTTTTQNDSAFTGRAGLVYLFDSGLAPYLSYAQSFDPVIGSVPGQKPFEPTRGEQYEAGLKFQPRGSQSFAQVSAYELTQENVLTSAGPGIRRQTGEVRSRGIEVEGRAALTDSLAILGSYTYTDARVTKSGDANLGKRPAYVSEHLASLWGEYKVHDGRLAGLGLGAGLRYVGETFDYTNALRVPGFTLADASIHYDFNGVRLALNASNLFDKEYVAACDNANFCYYGVGRTVLGTVSYRW